MVEYGIYWICPKCKQGQKRVCRINNDLGLTYTLMIQKARKTNLICLYCNFKIKWADLKPIDKKFINI